MFSRMLCGCIFFGIGNGSINRRTAGERYHSGGCPASCQTANPFRPSKRAEADTPFKHWFKNSRRVEPIDLLATSLMRSLVLDNTCCLFLASVGRGRHIPLTLLYGKYESGRMWRCGPPMIRVRTTPFRKLRSDILSSSRQSRAAPRQSGGRIPFQFGLSVFRRDR